MGTIAPGKCLVIQVCIVAGILMPTTGLASPLQPYRHAVGFGKVGALSKDLEQFTRILLSGATFEVANDAPFGLRPDPVLVKDVTDVATKTVNTILATACAEYQGGCNLQTATSPRSSFALFGKNEDCEDQRLPGNYILQHKDGNMNAFWAQESQYQEVFYGTKVLQVAWGHGFQVKPVAADAPQLSQNIAEAGAVKQAHAIATLGFRRSKSRLLAIISRLRLTFAQRQLIRWGHIMTSTDQGSDVISGWRCVVTHAGQECDERSFYVRGNRFAALLGGDNSIICTGPPLTTVAPTATPETIVMTTIAPTDAPSSPTATPTSDAISTTGVAKMPL